MSEQRVMPHSEEAEYNLLARVVIDPESIYDVPDIEPEHFFSTKYGHAFQAVRELVVDGKEPNVITIGEHLGLSFEDNWLLPLATDSIWGAPSSFGEIVFEKWKRREIIRAASKMAKAAWDDDISLDDVLSESSMLMASSLLDDQGSDIVTVKSAVHEIIEEVNHMISIGGGFQGLATGYEKLDNSMQGLKPGEMYVFGARPGMGKTQMLNNIAQSMFQSIPNLRVMYFSLEMSAKQLTYRLASQVTGLSFKKIYGGQVEENGIKHQSILRALGHISEWGLVVDQSVSTTPTQMFTRAQREIAMGGVDIIMIDYLQLMGVDGGYTGNRTRDVSAMSQGVKFLAKRLQRPVILSAQLSRASEKRPNPMPIMSDLRDSGEIEQDAGWIGGIYRPEYYLDAEEMMPGDVGKALVNVVKNRYDEPGIIEMGWEGKSGRFYNDITEVRL